WEIDTIYETQTVMVHDLCPIEGNPLCSGWYFHFDLASEAAAALGGGGLDAAVARRVPCPVTGNIHVQVNDWNQWGYVRVAFINHTIPVRTAEVQFTSLGTWHPMERSGGAWHLLDHPSPAAQDAILFRITSARGETVISENPVPLMDPGKFFDTGVQFVDTGEAATGECLFYPPADVYHDSWGGIDQVKWQPNPWGDATVSETSSDCYDGSASCLAVRNMEQWGGMHIYYRQEFPPSTFTALSFWIRAVSGSGTLTVALSRDGERCTEHDIAVDNEWTQVSLDPAVDCAGFPFINGITFSNTSPEFPFNLDEIHFDLP
ncbi:hypothetical protein KJ865_17395, partial [Myxococcota bacterium]|nr:hypothetical protein [Myxococcota bacterium]